MTPSASSSAATFAVPSYQLHPGQPPAAFGAGGMQFTPKRPMEKRYRSRGSSCFAWCMASLCCICCLLLLIIGGGLAAFFIWASKVQVNIQGITPAAGQALPSPASVISSSSLTMDMTAQIQVKNGNSLGVSLSQVAASGYVNVAAAGQPVSERLVATGVLHGVSIPGSATTTINFPFTVTYGGPGDPGSLAFKQMISNCGLNGGSLQNTPMSFRVGLQARLSGISVSVNFTQPASLPCPLPGGAAAAGAAAGAAAAATGASPAPSGGPSAPPLVNISPSSLASSEDQGAAEDPKLAAAAATPPPARRRR